VKLEGLQKDIATSFASPISREVWEKLKPYQDDDFVKFIERHLISH